MTLNKNIFVFVVFYLCSLTAFAAPNGEPIGEVLFSRGAISALNADQIRILGRNASVYRGDVLTTGKKSFAVVKLNDGTRLSLRPNSVLAMEKYSQDEGSENIFLRLFKGGLRAISGFISKQNHDAFKVDTVVATIGIRGTELDIRLCEANECAREAKHTETQKAVSKSSVIGRVAFLRKELQATDKDGAVRKMSRGAPIYEGDTLDTGSKSYAVLAFRDEGRITMKANTQFKIEQYSYDKQEPEEGNSFFRLIKGGIRALTGLISQKDPSKYRIDTVVATIGIRGTGLDLIWLGPCTGSPDCGLIASVWRGDIFATNDTGTQSIGVDETFNIQSISLPALLLADPPKFEVPRPDLLEINFEDLFGVAAADIGEAGLYVACYEGHCTILQGDKTLELGANEAGFASEDGTKLVRLEKIEPFQSEDPYLGAITEEFDTLFDILNDGLLSETDFECIVQ